MTSNRNLQTAVDPIVGRSAPGSESNDNTVLVVVIAAAAVVVAVALIAVVVVKKRNESILFPADEYKG